MKTITLRNIDEELKDVLIKRAQRSSTSLNGVVLKALREAFGLQKRPRQQRNLELEKLSGSWTKQDFKAFESSVTDFQKIDEELWK